MFRMKSIYFAVLFVCVVSTNYDLVNGNESSHPQVCIGTSHGLSYSHNGSDTQYRQQYENCTHILGNLEIVFLDRAYGRENNNRSYNLSFLSSIREVTGYVLIVGVHADLVPLTSLRIIRGQSLYTIEGSTLGYSLYVGQNYQPNAPGVGLKQLQFTSLHEIMDGNVMFHNNYELCFEETIKWNDILTGEGARAFNKKDDPFVKQCELCDPSCVVDEERRCWGSGPDMCQKLTRNCAPQCDGSCYGSSPNECCHPECVGGCSGPTKDKCWACRNVVNGDKCEPMCPTEFVYKQGRLVRNPSFKYTYGTVCVEKCPGHLLSVDGTCVSNCGDGYYEDSPGRCARCEGLCPKTCDISDFVNANNIASLANCTIINGIVKILQSTLESTSVKTPPISHVSELSVFESVREITGALVIQAKHEAFTSLYYFRNVQTIVGRQLQDQKFSLQVVGTSLKSLDLHSLKSIRYGSVFIVNNENLCHVDSVNWKKFSNNSIIRENGRSSNCTNCSEQCSDDGCWGPTDTDCVSCADYLISEQRRCVVSCELIENFYADNTARQCKPCNAECLRSCTGPTNGDCDSCRNLQDGEYCLSECPQSKFAEDGHCKPCSETCVLADGCSGPANSVGPGGCNFCSVVVYPYNISVNSYCLPSDTDCPAGFYAQFTRDIETGRRYQECRPCHPFCRKCNGPSTSACRECEYLNETDPEGVSRCVSLCSSGYFADQQSSQCLPCDSLCSHCYGRSASQCLACHHFILYKDLDNRPNSSFVCVESCPAWAPRHVTEHTRNHTSAVCLTDALFQAYIGGSVGKPVGAIVGGVLGGIVVFGLIAVVVVYIRWQWARSEENKARIHAKITGTPLDELEPLALTDAQPDMAQLKIVKESEIMKFEIIGSGAFGTVYKGVWTPPEENVKVLVAIKVLREGSSAVQNAELLEEARIMASVIHPNCTRIIAVCMTAQMMLVMPFVPNGCLLDYVRKNQANVGSKALLNWGTQIARGMDYLESRGIVHRDLAARNVLVHSVNLVKITDFGLAKLLDTKQELFQATGGKMPIKWLAVESIQHRIFTHKSDVWSYGVTMWELFTYGQRPYDNVPAYDIPDLLEKGERLSQPAICTIDVYMILIKCWMLDASSRPSFKELAENFAKMARDPGRYLVIQGDDLMRLPDRNYLASELLNDLGSGGQELMTVDDYLQPQHLASYQPCSKSDIALNKLKSADSGRHKKRDLESAEGDVKYGGLDSCKSRPGDHRSSSRYISDPTGKLGQEAIKADATFPPQQPVNVDAASTVTEDDYLQPHTSVHSPAYMDVISDDNNGIRSSSATNPEYFENGRSKRCNPPKQRTEETDYYNSDVGTQRAKQSDSATKSQRGFISESAV